MSSTNYKRSGPAPGSEGEERAESRAGGCASLLAPVAGVLSLRCHVFSLALLGRRDAAGASLGRLMWPQDVSSSWGSGPMGKGRAKGKITTTPAVLCSSSKAAGFPSHAAAGSTFALLFANSKTNKQTLVFLLFPKPTKSPFPVEEYVIPRIFNQLRYCLLFQFPSHDVVRPEDVLSSSP